jgi:hypothetical protein
VEKLYQELEQAGSPYLWGVRELIRKHQYNDAVAVLKSAKLALEAEQEHFTQCPFCKREFEDDECGYTHDHFRYLKAVVEYEYDEGGFDTCLYRLETDAEGQHLGEVWVAGYSRSHNAPCTGTIWVRSGNWDGKTPFTTVELVQVATICDPELHELQKAEIQAAQDLAHIQSGQDKATQLIADAEGEILARLDMDYGTDEIIDGTPFEVEFTEETRKGQTQIVAGPFFDEPSGKWLKLVPHRWTETARRIKPGWEGIVEVREKSDDQVHFFTYLTDNPEGHHGRGGRKVQVWGYSVVPILPPEAYDEELRAARAAHQAAQTALETYRTGGQQTQPPAKVEPHRQVTKVEEGTPGNEGDDDDEGETSMAAAFKKAGWKR